MASIQSNGGGGATRRESEGVYRQLIVTTGGEPATLAAASATSANARAQRLYDDETILRRVEAPKAVISYRDGLAANITAGIPVYDVIITRTTRASSCPSVAYVRKSKNVRYVGCSY